MSAVCSQATCVTCEDLLQTKKLKDLLWTTEGHTAAVNHSPGTGRDQHSLFQMKRQETVIGGHPEVKHMSGHMSLCSISPSPL